MRAQQIDTMINHIQNTADMLCTKVADEDLKDAINNCLDLVHMFKERIANGDHHK